MLKGKLSQPLRATFFFGGLLVLILMAAYVAPANVFLRSFLALIVALVMGVGSYGVIPTKENVAILKADLAANGKKASGLNYVGWVFWVALVGIGMQLVAHFAE